VTALVRDAETGQPLAGAVCIAAGSDVMSVAAADGSCAAQVSGRGWRLVASAAGYLTDSVAWTAAQQGRIAISLFRDLPRVVRGRVIEATSGRPLQAEVIVGSRVVSARADGGFVLERFPKGEQVLQAMLDGFVGDRQTVLARGSETTEVLFRLRDTSDVGSVSGVVTDEAGRAAIPGAALHIDSGAFVCRTDTLGQYRIDRLPAGEYWLVCQAQDHAAQKIRFRVLKDWTVAVCFRLKRARAR
jgi:hypothetical protein